MKIILSLLIVGLIFMPGYAFAWKSLSYNDVNDCTFACSTPYASIDHSSPMNFLLLAATSMIGLGVYYKFSRTAKYAVFSLKCESCGRKTNGLKCSICEESKQRAN